MDSPAIPSNDTQELQEKDKSLENLNCTLSILSEILAFCDQHPKLSMLATHGLNDIISKFSPENAQDGDQLENKTRAEKEIKEHISDLKKKHRQIRATTNIYKDIATFLSRKHGLDFDPKAMNTTADLFPWFDEHWDMIKDQFFILFDKHPNNR